MIEFKFDARDLTLTIEEFSERYLIPACDMLKDSLKEQLWPGASCLVWYRGSYRALRG